MQSETIGLQSRDFCAFFLRFEKFIVVEICTIVSEFRNRNIYFLLSDTVASCERYELPIGKSNVNKFFRWKVLDNSAGIDVFARRVDQMDDVVARRRIADRRVKVF